MATEKFANNAATTLSGAILDTSQSLVVSSASGFPTNPQFRIKIDNELILVTGVSGTTYTVTRGQEGTSGVGHADGATVTHVLTAGALAQFQGDTFTAGGDLSGTSTSQTVAKIQGTTLDPAMSGSVTNDVLTWDGSKWTHLPIPNAGAGGWVTALDTDFSAQANQTLSPDGNYTIGGFTWAKQNSSNDRVAMAVVNGQGIVMQPNNGGMDYYASTRTVPLLWLPLSGLAIPNLSLATALRISAYLSADNSGSISGVADFMFGVDNDSLYWSWTAYRGNHDSGAGLTLCRILNQSRTIRQQQVVTVGSSNATVCLTLPRLDSPQAFGSAGTSSAITDPALLQAFAGGLDTAGGLNTALIGSGPHGNSFSEGLGILIGAIRPVAGSNYSVTLSRLRVEYNNGGSYWNGVYPVTVPITSNYQIVASDSLIPIGALTSAITLTLPSNPTRGEFHKIKDSGGTSGSYNVTISGNGKLIDGASTFVLDTNYMCLELFYTGSQWSVG